MDIKAGVGWSASVSPRVRSDMINRYILFTLLGILITACFALPANAQTETWSVGGGYWTMPNLEGESVDSSGFYGAAVMRSMQYMLELDYAIDDPGFLVLAADYLYPLSSGATGSFGGNGYIGAGYTYFSADDLENESGFNIIAAAELGNSLFGSIRYDFLGNDQEMITFSVTYSFY